MFRVDRCATTLILNCFHAQHIASILVAVSVLVCSCSSCVPVLHSMSIATRLHNLVFQHVRSDAQDNDLPWGDEAIETPVSAERSVDDQEHA